MHSINILDSAIYCAQGDLQSTLASIKNGNISIGSKEVKTLEDTIDIPYFLLPEDTQSDQDAIYSRIKSVITPIIEKLDKDQRKKTAVIVGTALVDMYIIDAIHDTVYEDERKPYATHKRSIDTYAKKLSCELGLNNFTMTINTACTSSINAVLEARNLINSGVFDYALVIGIEVFSQMMSDGFSSMKLLSSKEQRPFDASRDGLVLGEAIASVLVGKKESLWKLKGGYSNCNSLNITSVGPDGVEYAEVMEKAMEYAGVTQEDITALKAHATSTPTNDQSEIRAIAKVFEPTTNFTALKPYTGHTLGACGILELAIFMEAVDQGFIPKTINHQTSIIPEYVPLLESKECKEGIFMLNYFGFGGNNTSVIIQKELA
jgi:3-oxoacyl-[acyl-carrier-protein] synthase I